MGWRFRQSLRLLPGIRLNFSKTGISTSIGGNGATLNLSRRGVRSTVGLPGTGISYSTLHSGDNAAGSNSGVGCLVLVALAIGLAIAASRCTPAAAPVASPPQPQTSVAPPSATHSVRARMLNCRAKPGSSAAIIARLPHGTVVMVDDAANGWAPVDRTPPCWVRADWLADKG